MLASRLPNARLNWCCVARSRSARSRDISPAPSQREIDGLAVALTEQRNPRSQNLEKMTAHERFNCLLRGSLSRRIADRHRGSARAIEIVTESLRNDGRLFYVGAGSSGRIGVLDASEIPPPLAHRRILCGSDRRRATALHRSVEGAEDEESAGAFALDERGVKPADVVIGITASARHLLCAARSPERNRSAQNHLLTCNPHMSLWRQACRLRREKLQPARLPLPMIC